MPVRSFSGFLAAALLLSLAAAPVSARRHDPNRTDLKTVFLTKPPPDFAYDRGLGPQRLRDFVGRPVILNFWASWCEPCTAELGAFAKVRETYGEQVGMLTVNSESAGVARRYLEAHAYRLPLVEDSDRKISDLYSVAAIPVTIVIGRDGAVRQVVVGELSWEELRSALDAELGAPPSAAPAVSSGTTSTARRDGTR